MNQRRKRNSSKTNLIISAVFHSALILAIFFFAAREGMLGKRLKTLAVTMAPKEKKPEPPKEKPAEPKVEQPKPAETPKLAVTAPPPAAQRVAPPPPVAEAPAAAAPPAVSLPSFEFSDGAKEVQTVSDPKVIYKGLVETALRSHWNRPEDINDETYVAEVELDIDSRGQVTGSHWVRGSGDRRWDDSVKSAVTATKALSRPPPKNFPSKFLARFDVETSRTEEVIQLSSR